MGLKRLNSPSYSKLNKNENVAPRILSGFMAPKLVLNESLLFSLSKTIFLVHGPIMFKTNEAFDRAFGWG
jgi:hypothetical protein